MLSSFLNRKKKDQTPEMKEKLISLTCTECGRHFGYLSSYITKGTSDHIDSIKYITKGKELSNFFFCSEECYNAYYNKSKDDGN